MNKIILTGNLGHGATVRDVPKRGESGTTPVVNFSLAVKVGYGDSAETVWYACSWWGERAARVAEWLTRGRRVLVEGMPWLRTFEKRDKSMGAEIAVRVDNVELLGDARGDAAQTSDDGRQATDQAAPAAEKKPAAENLDEDVPF